MTCTKDAKIDFESLLELQSDEQVPPSPPVNRGKILIENYRMGMPVCGSSVATSDQ